MRVYVLIAVRYGEGCHTQYPPCVWHLQQCVRAGSAAAFQATSGGFLWTRDSLFGVLRRRHTRTTPASGFAFFTALLDVGECEEEADVVALLLTELCTSWPGDIAAHLEVCRAEAGPAAVGSVAGHVTREETLLLLLADDVEATPAVQAAFLRRWGVAEAWDCTTALQGRCWLVRGGVVAILPAVPTGEVVASFLEVELPHFNQHGSPGAEEGKSDSVVDFSAAMEEALSRAVLERSLTGTLHTSVVEAVRDRVERRPLQRCVAAVPPAMALFLRRLPSRLLQECVLHHTVDCPLAPLAADRTATPTAKHALTEADDVVVPARSGNTLAATAPCTSAHCYRVADEESRRLADLFHEYDLLLSNQVYVRVPLAPVTRYVFAQLLCRTELPAALMLLFIRQHAEAVSQGVASVEDLGAGPSTSASRATSEEEVVLGMKLTWAVSRWTAAMRRPATSMTPFSAWNTERIDAHEGLAKRVQRHMRVAKQAAAELQLDLSAVADTTPITATAAHGCSSGADGVPCSSSEPRTAPLKRQRVAPLRRLEERLFAPYTPTYRGSSTAWVQEALRDVGAEQACAALSVAPDDAAAMAALTEEHASDPRSSAEDGDATSDSSSTTTADEREEVEGQTAQEGEAGRMLAQLAELESVLQRELKERHTDRSGASASDASVASWLTGSDVQEVARNELFQRHVHLLESEMRPRARRDRN